VDPDIIRRFFLSANPNPNREGCPGNAVLQAIAENTLAPNDPARLHLAHCSPCFSEFRELKLRREAQQAKQNRTYRWQSLAIAAGLILAVFLALRLWFSYRASASVELAAAKTVNLEDRGAVRGEQEPDATGEAITLPHRFVRLQVILPRFSTPGSYTIGVTRTKAEKNMVEGTTVAVKHGPQMTVTISIDLHSIRPGHYFLSVIHGPQDPPNYYSVTIHEPR
jgi:hypothetical protein